MANFSQSDKVGIDSAVYSEFKKQALDNSLKRKEFSLSSVHVNNPEEVVFGKTKMKMTEEAFYSFVKVLNLNKQIVSKLDNTLGEKATATIMDLMRKSIASSGKQTTVVAVLNEKTGEIVDFRKNATNVLSNSAMLNLFEDVMEAQSGMRIKNLSTTSSGSLEINVLNDNWEFGMSDMKDEMFKSGLCFTNTATKSIISPFNERLICANGMVAMERGMSIVLESNDRNSVTGFFDAVRSIKDVNFFEDSFKSKITRAVETVASYREMMSVYNLILGQIAYEAGDMNAAAQVYGMLDHYIPEKEVRAAYLAAGYDLGVNTKSWKLAKTNTSIWELINALTYCATHLQSQGFRFKYGESSVFNLQKMAGDLTFRKDYDLGVKLPSVY
jgi:hypothetical protein